MALDAEHLRYPHRRYGMDHNRYAWSMLAKRPPVAFPHGKRIALWVNVSLQYFPLNSTGKPFKAPGSLTMPYPDLRHYTLRDYGNRVGIYRILKALERYNVTATFAVNAALAERVPYLMNVLTGTGAEILAHGWDMDTLHYGGMSNEAELIDKTLTTLRGITKQPVTGWLSPARSESADTPDLLAARGIRYFCDWVNDDMPYAFNTAYGTLVAMPLSYELEDQFILMNNQHSEASYAEQVMDSFDALVAESLKDNGAQGGRILSLSVHPWMLGQPHRTKYFERVLDYVMASPLVWTASASEILASCGL